MNYLNEEQITYCLAHQDVPLMRWVGKRLILENVDEDIYNTEMSKAFPELVSEYKTLFKEEAIPTLSLQTYDDGDFTSFIEATPLATLKIETFGNYKLLIGTGVNTKKDITYTNEYYIQVVDGKFYDRVETIFETDNGEETMINTKLKLSIRLRIKYAYHDGDNIFIGYRVGKDKKDRNAEISQGIDNIKTLYHLSAKDCYAIKLYLDDIIPKYLHHNRPVDARLSIVENRININYPITFDEKKALEALINTYNVTTQKELMNFLMLYAPITPFNVQLRQKEMIMSLPMALGKGGAGKSAMTKMVIVKGFDNPEAEKSEDDIFTKASFRENFSKSIFPIMIDEITQFTMQRIYGSIKNLATGKGTHSRGRPSGGLNEWTLSSIPFFTSNETIYIDSGMERRFFKIIANDTDNDIQAWRKAKQNLPDGFLYMFLKELDGMTIDELVAEIIKYVKHDEDYIYAYQSVIKNIMDKVFSKYGLECPFEPVRKITYDDDDWYIAFGQFVSQNVYDATVGNNSYLREGFDFEIDKLRGGIYITKLGFQKFLKLFPRCPFRNASSFAINASSTQYEYNYVKKRVCHAKNPIHVIYLFEKGEYIQTEFPTSVTQLNNKIVSK